MSEIVTFRPRNHLYEAKEFTAGTADGSWRASGTFCGHVDLVIPVVNATLILSPDEIQSIIIMLKQAREDVLTNSRPIDDPRLI